MPGIEPGSPAWQAGILSHYTTSDTTVQVGGDTQNKIAWVFEGFFVIFCYFLFCLLLFVVFWSFFFFFLSTHQQTPCWKHTHKHTNKKKQTHKTNAKNKQKILKSKKQNKQNTRKKKHTQTHTKKTNTQRHKPNKQCVRVCSGRCTALWCSTQKIALSGVRTHASSGDYDLNVAPWTTRPSVLIRRRA